MKSINVKDSNGLNITGWKFETFTAWNCGGHVSKARIVKGWKLISPDKIERYNEGNWQQFVPFAQLIFSNHGLTSNLS